MTLIELAVIIVGAVFLLAALVPMLILLITGDTRCCMKVQIISDGDVNEILRCQPPIFLGFRLSEA